ncbi:unnamed protein product, partial [Polarella glacialis]
ANPIGSSQVRRSAAHGSAACSGSTGSGGTEPVSHRLCWHRQVLGARRSGEESSLCRRNCTHGICRAAPR